MMPTPKLKRSNSAPHSLNILTYKPPPSYTSCVGQPPKYEDGYRYELTDQGPPVESGNLHAITVQPQSVNGSQISLVSALQSERFSQAHRDDRTCKKFFTNQSGCTALAAGGCITGGVGVAAIAVTAGVCHGPGAPTVPIILTMLTAASCLAGTIGLTFLKQN